MGSLKAMGGWFWGGIDRMEWNGMNLDLVEYHIQGWVYDVSSWSSSFGVGGIDGDINGDIEISGYHVRNLTYMASPGIIC